MDMEEEVDQRAEVEWDQSCYQDSGVVNSGFSKVILVSMLLRYV